ncbi:hypothetical protein GCM10017752_42020 [Streptomyces roseoviridis]
MTAEEVADQCRDLLAVRLQGEVARVEEVDLGVRQVPGERLGAGRAEDLVAAAPGGEQRRPVGAEVLLEGRIGVQVELVVPEQLELDLLVAGPVEAGPVEGPGLGTDAVQALGRDAVGVLPAGGLGGQQPADVRLVRLPVRGVREQDVPEGREALG